MRERDLGVLDGPVLNYSVNGMYYDGQHFDQAAQAGEFLDLIGSSYGPEAAAFRQAYGQHLLDNYVLNEGVDPLRRSAAAGIAAELITGDYSRPEIAVNTLAGYSADEVDAMAESGLIANAPVN